MAVKDPVEIGNPTPRPSLRCSITYLRPSHPPYILYLVSTSAIALSAYIQSQSFTAPFALRTSVYHPGGHTAFKAPGVLPRPLPRHLLHPGFFTYRTTCEPDLQSPWNRKDLFYQPIPAITELQHGAATIPKAATGAAFIYWYNRERDQGYATIGRCHCIPES